jgi:hypothetical protein
MKNWRTTLIGAITAALVAIGPIIDAAQGEAINWAQLALAACIAVLSYLAKDAGVTGTDK